MYVGKYVNLKCEVASNKIGGSTNSSDFDRNIFLLIYCKFYPEIPRQTRWTTTEKLNKPQ